MAARKIILFSLLALVTGWSLWLTQKGKTPILETTDTGIRPTLEYYVKNSTITTFDPSGQRTRRLRSDAISHFLGSGNTELDMLQLETFSTGAVPEWRLQSAQGELSEDGKKLLLSGTVEIDQEQGSEGVPLHIVTSDVTLEPEKEYAETDAPATIIQGDNRITSVGMQAWFGESAHIKFNAKTRGHYGNL